MQMIDYNVKVRVNADGSGVDLANVNVSMNPFGKIAVEEAIRLSEVDSVEEIVAVSTSVKQVQETLHTALTMGADRAILVVAADDARSGVVLCGKQAIDNDMNATGQVFQVADFGLFADLFDVVHELTEKSG